VRVKPAASAFAVLGGVGTIGRTVVRDLFASHRHNRVLVADYNESGAREYARSFRSARVRAAFADAADARSLAALLRGRAVLINCTQHDFNLTVMRAALSAGAHYVDLGGLFHWTRQQLRLDSAFRRAGLTAVLGMGCAPGITNVMARCAAARLGRAHSIMIYVGSRDRKARPGEFYFPYSAQTIIEELTLPPWVFRNGRFRQAPPRSGWQRVKFPRPVGTVWVVRTRHSEIATLPLTLRAHGLRDCEFKVSFDRAFVREVTDRLQQGWTVKDFAGLPRPDHAPADHEIARVVATGGSSKPRRLILDCVASARPQWNASAGDMDTGCPPSIVAQFIAAGRIVERGVFPPETIVPAEALFAELARRKIKIIARSPSR
jgi:saccharopine dehydrogenase-like NADP-dependent oxidoreductase